MLTVGKEEQWDLPPINKVSYELSDVDIKPTESLKDFIKYELRSKTVTVTFSGGDIESMHELIGKSLELQITLRGT